MNPLAPVLKVVRCSPSNHEPALDPVMLDAPPVAEGEAKKDAPITSYFFTRDPELLRFLPDMKPTWFHLRRLPASWMCAVLDNTFPRPAQRLLALRAALHTIETPTEVLSVQAPGEKGPFVATPADYGVTLAPHEWVQEIADRWGLDAVQEMGELVIVHSRLPRGARGPFGAWGGSVATP